MEDIYKKRIAFVVTHPIQYYSPIFKRLTENNDSIIRVFYTWGVDSINKYDPDFKTTIEWNVPLLDGYDYFFCNNIAQDKGSHHFHGIDAIDLHENLLQFNPDIVCLFGWNYKSHLKLILNNKNKYIICLFGDSHLLDRKNKIYEFFRRIYVKYVFSKINYFFYVGKNNYEYYKYFGVRNNQLYYVNHSIDDYRFSTERKEEVEILRKEYNILESDKVILYVGKLEYKKGIDLLINVVKEINEVSYKLIIVGDGQLKEVVQNNLGDNIIYVGLVNQSEMPLYYKLADVLVLPSRGPGETWGLVINEAMVNGLAIIASDKVGSAIDLVNGNGYIFRIDKIYELKEVLIKVFNPEELPIMKQKSLEISKLYSLDIAVKRYSNAFEGILAKG